MEKKKRVEEVGFVVRAEALSSLRVVAAMGMLASWALLSIYSINLSSAKVIRRHCYCSYFHSFLIFICFYSSKDLSEPVFPLDLMLDLERPGPRAEVPGLNGSLGCHNKGKKWEEMEHRLFNLIYKYEFYW